MAMTFTGLQWRPQSPKLNPVDPGDSQVPKYLEALFPGPIFQMEPLLETLLVTFLFILIVFGIVWFLLSHHKLVPLHSQKGQIFSSFGASGRFGS